MFILDLIITIIVRPTTKMTQNIYIYTTKFIYDEKNHTSRSSFFVSLNKL